MSSPHIERTSVTSNVPPPPVVPMAAGAEERVVNEPPREMVAPTSSGRVASFTHITPARVIAAAGGVVLLVIGLIAVAKAGLGGPLDQPVVQVAGMSHTALLGLIGAAFGLALLATGVIGTDAGSRSGSLFVGTLLGIGGVVAIATPESFKSLAVQSSYGWLMLIIGSIVVAAQLLLPSITARKVTYR